MSAVHAGPQTILDTVHALAPQIAGAADEIERTRELPRPLFEALADAGLFHLLVPRQLGGLELDLPTYVEVLEALGRADASTAWCINQGGIFATHAVCVPPDFAQEIWFDQPHSVVANTPTPTATAVAVDGGYLVTGRQGYSTGSRHSNWIAARGFVQENGKPRLVENGRPDMRFFLIPVGEVQLLDTWHTRGLRGTGTHHFEIRDHFVPERRTFFPFAPARPEFGALYKVPRSLLFATGDATIALAVARNSISAFVELATTKIQTYRTDLVRDQSYVQIKLGEAESLLGAAQAFLYEQVRAGWAVTVQQGTMPMEQRIGLRAATTFALRNAAQVVDTLYNLAGGTVVLESHPLQRLFQDAHVITQHVQAREQHYELVGRYLLGLEPDSQYV
jgi:alkylation response protein AidB-like acyl-CoA dehydrogenase